MRPGSAAAAPGRLTRAAAYLAERRAVRQPVIIDLGCGGRKIEGALGVDRAPLSGVDLVHDLSVRPYPLPEGAADVIVLHHVLEHFADPLPVMEEVWRIARPGAVVRIRTPHYSGRYAWNDPTHRRAFSSESFRYFGENEYSYCTAARFEVRQARMKYFMEEELWPRAHRLWGRLVQRMLDRHPTFAERFLCYLVGGIEELQVELVAVKHPAAVGAAGG